MDFIVNNWILFLALAVVLFMLFGSTLGQSISGIKRVNPFEAVQLINHERAVVVDVCEPREYDEGHVGNAINIPLGSLQQRISELDKYKTRPVIVSCRSGQRSNRGAGILKKNGFEQVFNLGGGIVAWQRENLPMEK